MRKSAYTPNFINSLPVVMVLGMLDLLLLVLMLKMMFSDHSSQELGHSDLVSGLVGHLNQRHLNAKLEVHRPNGYEMCKSHGRMDILSDSLQI